MKVYHLIHKQTREPLISFSTPIEFRTRKKAREYKKLLDEGRKYEISPKIRIGVDV